jgi:hypothetical protein
MKYEVDVKEVWTRTFTIESDVPLTIQELREKANELLEEGEEEEVLDYSSTCEPEEWPARIVEIVDDRRVVSSMN